LKLENKEDQNFLENREENIPKEFESDEDEELDGRKGYKKRQK